MFVICLIVCHEEALLQYKQETTVDLYMINIGIAALTQEKNYYQKKNVGRFILQYHKIMYLLSRMFLHIELTSKCKLHCFIVYRNHMKSRRSNRLDVNELRNYCFFIRRDGKLQKSRV